MKLVEYISQIASIDSKYIILFSKTILFLSIMLVVKKIGINILRHIKDNKKEYICTQRYKLLINITKILIVITIWSEYLGSFLTLISVVSAAFTIAIRDLIFNFFCGLYIKIAKPFVVEDRIEINNFKGDVININTLNFEVLEVNNQAFTGQSTGVITHLPNSIIFNYPLRNYNKAFKYIWNEIIIKIPLDSNLQKSKSVIYKIINSNEIIRNIPLKMKKQINNISSDYRIYFNQYDPIIYTKVVDTHIELTARYLIHPKKARYVESIIWGNILLAYQNGEINLLSD